MSINTAIMSTAVARRSRTDNNWTVQSPLAGFVATGKDKQNALTKFIEMLGAYMFAQQRQSQGKRERGRPSKNYDAHIHVQVQKETKERFDAVAIEFNLSQSETIVFLLDSLEILRDDFVSKTEMDEAEGRVLQLAGAK
jgi:hypothetical protein